MMCRIPSISRTKVDECGTLIGSQDGDQERWLLLDGELLGLKHECVNEQ